MMWMWRRLRVVDCRLAVGWVVRSAPLAVAAGLVACASASPSPRPLSLTGAAPASTARAAPDSARIMVKLRNPLADRAVVVADAQAVAGVPVRAGGTVTPEWQALSLDCADAAACDAAVERLRADTGRYLLVEIDRRESTLPPPRDRALSR